MGPFGRPEHVLTPTGVLGLRQSTCGKSVWEAGMWHGREDRLWLQAAVTVMRCWSRVHTKSFPTRSSTMLQMQSSCKLESCPEATTILGQHFWALVMGVRAGSS